MRVKISNGCKQAADETKSIGRHDKNKYRFGKLNIVWTEFDLSVVLRGADQQNRKST